MKNVMMTIGGGLAGAMMLATAWVGRAHAVEIYPETIPPPRVIVVTQPSDPPPVRIVVRRPPPPDRVLIRVRAPEPRAATRDEDAPRLVLGAGIGPMFVLGADSVVPVGHAHVGLALGQVEFGLRLGLAPYAASLSNVDGEPTDTCLYTTDATFTYRFLPDADLHPILGAGLGAVIAAPSGAPPSAGFGVSLRAGLELGVDLPDAGELGVGLDAIGTQVVGAEAGFPWALATSLTVGAHLDWRF